MSVTPPRAVRVAALWCAVYPSILALESFWVGVMSRWLRSAAEYAGSYPLRHAFQTGAGAAVGLTCAWFLLKGARWAYRLAVFWFMLIGGIALVWMVVILAMVPRSGLQSFASAHPTETVAIVPAFVSIWGSLFSLLRRETRQFFSSPPLSRQQA